MIDQLSGIVAAIHEKSITLAISGFGLSVYLPQPQKVSIGAQLTLDTYLHWNAEQGPSIYGFERDLDRRVFLLIIDCPKIGPSIALNILSQISAPQFLELITTHNETGLSKLHGIGAKKAEQLIVQLKDKVQKLLKRGDVVLEEQHNFVMWQELGDVLASLNYSKQEVSRVTLHLTEKYTGQQQPLDQLIRAALAFLSQKQV